MEAKNSELITKKELMQTFWRSFTVEWSWNYERQMNIGFAYSMLPALQKIYSNKEEVSRACARHLEFFNITPWIITFPLGISIALEEKNAKESNFDTSTINNIKVALMGPLSGLGDSFFWGTLRIIATAIGTSLALQGNILGPILFLLIFNIPAQLIRYYGLSLGYHLGANFIDSVLKSGLMERLTYGAAVLGLAVIGAMTASMVTLNIPLLVGTGEQAQTVSDLFNSVVPGILPLLFTLFLLYLVKKGVKSHWILIMIAILGILGAYTGLLG